MLLVVGCDRVSYGHATYADFILEEKIQVFKHKEMKKIFLHIYNNNAIMCNQQGVQTMIQQNKKGI